MKRRYKCIKLLALLGLPLLLFSLSSDVNALKHNVRSIPFAVPLDYDGASNSLYENFELVYNIQDQGVDDYNPKDDYAFRSRKSEDHCYYQSDYNAFSDNGITLGYRMPYFLDYASYREHATNQSGPFNLYQGCNRLNPLPANYDWNSVPPYVFGHPDLRSLNPYWYQFNGAYGFNTVSEDGLSYNVRLTMEDIFGRVPNKFQSIQIPLGLTTNEFGEVYTGRSIEIRGEWMFDSDDPVNDTFTFLNREDTKMILNTGGYTSQENWELQNPYRTTMVCDWDLKRNTNELEYPWILSYSCPWVADHDYMTGYLGFTLRFVNQHQGDAYIWDYPATTWLSEASYIITDHNDTPGADFGLVIEGGDIENAPGSGYSGSSQKEPDFFESLSKLFSFGFLNPFAGIFGLFSDQNQCANIPTLAGMIHADETTVCPWFDSTTRNIVTPVLGMASVMLVFGFAVRWLGARSGNFMEDSGETFESSGLKVGRKGRH